MTFSIFESKPQSKTLNLTGVYSHKNKNFNFSGLQMMATANRRLEMLLILCVTKTLIRKPVLKFVSQNLQEKGLSPVFSSRLMSPATYITLGVVHKLCWQDFGFSWPPTHLRWHFLWYESWQKVDIFGLPTYLVL